MPAVVLCDSVKVVTGPEPAEHAHEALVVGNDDELEVALLASRRYELCERFCKAADVTPIEIGGGFV